MKKVKILTQNLWLHNYVGGKFPEQRIRNFVKQLAKSDYDVLLLQEVFLLNLGFTYLGYSNRQLLISECDKIGFKHIAEAKRPYFPFQDSGLLILSKFPVSDAYSHKFKQYTRNEVTNEKGFLSAVIKVDDFEIFFLNIHLNSVKGAAQDSQIVEVEQYLNKVSLNYKNIVIGGDFNNQMKETFCRLENIWKGKVEPATCPTEKPFLFLDHIFTNMKHSEELLFYEKSNPEVSDHKGISCTLLL